MESYSAETIPKKICTPLIDEEVGESINVYHLA